MVNINFKAHSALPCTPMIFTINNINADIDDFGYSTTYNQIGSDDELDKWGCRCREWYKFKDCLAKDRACAKYNITYDDFEEIGDFLEGKLTIGDCGWCI